jgi:hypothetical protein
MRPSKLNICVLSTYNKTYIIKLNRWQHLSENANCCKLCEQPGHWESQWALDNPEPVDRHALSDQEECEWCLMSLWLAMAWIKNDMISMRARNCYECVMVEQNLTHTCSPCMSREVFYRCTAQLWPKWNSHASDPYRISAQDTPLSEQKKVASS